LHVAFGRTKRLTAWYFWEVPRQLILRTLRHRKGVAALFDPYGGSSNLSGMRAEDVHAVVCA